MPIRARRCECPAFSILRRHPDLAFHIDVTLTEKDGRWLAVAMLADEPDVRTGSDPRRALQDALKALGEPLAWDLADSAELGL